MQVWVVILVQEVQMWLFFIEELGSKRLMISFMIRIIWHLRGIEWQLVDIWVVFALIIIVLTLSPLSEFFHYIWDCEHKFLEPHKNYLQSHSHLVDLYVPHSPFGISSKTDSGWTFLKATLMQNLSVYCRTLLLFVFLISTLGMVMFRLKLCLIIVCWNDCLSYPIVLEDWNVE